MTRWALIFLLQAVAILAQTSPGDQLNALLENAQSALNAGKRAEAGDILDQAIARAAEQLGSASLQLGELHRAGQAFEAALDASPDCLECLRGRAIHSLKAGDYRAGIEAVQTILRIAPSYPDASHLLGKLLYMDGQYPEAAAQLARSFSEAPDNISLAYTLALVYLKQKKRAEAAEVFRKIVEQRGEAAQLHLLFGRAYRDTADIKDKEYGAYLGDAAREFQEAIRLDPNLPRAHYYLAMTFLRSEGMLAGRQAVTALEQELRIDPDSYLANYHLGLLHTQNREYAKAIRHLLKAHNLDPRNHQPYLLLGRCYYWSGQYDECIRILTGLLELEKQAGGEFDDSNVHYLLGRALLKTGRKERAEEHLTLSRSVKERFAREDVQVGGTSPEDSAAATVINDEPPTAEQRRALERLADLNRRGLSTSYQLRARVAAEENDYRSTAVWLEKAAQVHDGARDLYFNLGVAYYKGGEPAKAVRPLILDLQREPTREAARQLLANLSLQLINGGQYEPALEAVQFLVDRYPAVPDLYLLLARINQELGRKEEAGKAMSRYRDLTK